MNLAGAVVVVTGGASGIGAALATRFAAEGAAGVVVADLDPEGARAVAEGLSGDVGYGVGVDVSVEADVVELVAATESRFGPVDLFCSNAGVGAGGGFEATDDVWAQAWGVNLMAHVYAARAVVPGMVARGGGYLLQTASAAGLLTNLANAPYSVTKHGAVAFAEWLAITYGDAGVKVSCLCPQGVRTPMLLGGAAAGDAAAASVLAAADVLEPAAVADAVVAGLAEERFLILPHPEVATYWRNKADDPDRWLAGMRRLQARLLDSGSGDS